MADWTNLLTGLLGAGASIYSANQQSNAIQNAANTAAQQSQFRPVGITTRFGSSGFQYDPATGQLVGAGYQVAPDVAAMREALLGLSGGQLSQAQQAQAMAPQIGQAAQGLFGLGMGYLGQSPQAAAQQWMSQQQQLLAPGREQELARYTNAEYNRGTLGLGVGATREGYMAPQQQSIQPMPQVASAGPAMLSAPVQAGFKGPAPVSTAVPVGDNQGFMLPSRTPQGYQSPAPVAQAPNPLAKPEGPRLPEMFTTQPVEALPEIMYAQGGRTVDIQPIQAQQQQMQGLAASNPRFAALYNARAAQDAQLAAQAQQAGMQQAQFGQGLLSNALGLQGQGYGLQTQALAPFTNYLAGAGNIENMGIQALTQGTGLGSAITAGATNAAAIQQQAANQAAQLAAMRNQAVVGGLQDPVAALIGALTR